MKKLTLAILLALLLCTSAYAAQWYEAYRDSDYLISVDASSIKLEGDIITVWEKWVCRTPKSMRKYNKRTITFDVRQVKYDVKTRRMQEVYIIEYDKNKNTVYSGNLYEGWKPIPPDTIGEYMLAFYEGYAYKTNNNY